MNPITLERAGLPYGVADAGDIGSQEIMERIFAMLQAKGETLHNLSSRPAAI